MIKIHQHNLSDFLFCRRKFNLTVNKKIVPRITPEQFVVGGMFANTIEQCHNGMELKNCFAYIAAEEQKAMLTATTQEAINKIETRKATIMAMVGGYSRNFKDDDWEEIVPEYKVIMPILDFEYICTLDGKIIDKEGKNWVLELKTTTQLQKDTIEKLPLNFQVLSYYLALRKHLGEPIKGVYYRHIKKPTIKLKKNETPWQFQRRIATEYIEYPEKYFHQEKILFDINVLEEFEKELYQKFIDLERCYNNNFWYKNEVNCNTKYGNCVYLPYCINPTIETLETYYRTETRRDI